MSTLPELLDKLVRKRLVSCEIGTIAEMLGSEHSLLGHLICIYTLNIAYYRG